MFVIVWKYAVRSDRVEEFVEAYGPDGAWVDLFRTAEGFAGTELIACDEPGWYLTIDRWVTKSAFDAFLEDRRGDYDRLDERLAALTSAETLLGRGRRVEDDSG